MSTIHKPATTAVAEKDKPTPSASVSLTVRIAQRYGVDERKLMDTLRATAFKTKDGDPAVTDHQMMALMVVADQYELNPFTKEIFAFPDKKNGIVPVVSVDGWARIINEHPQLDGFEFRYSDSIIHPNENPILKGMIFPAHEWIECVFYRKDRVYPIVIREYFEEVYRPPFEGKGNNGPYVVNGPWQSHGKRMHRHKALIQGARLAFGFAGIYDEDEANRIEDANQERVVHTVQGKTRAEQALNAINAGSANKKTHIEGESTPVPPREQASSPPAETNKDPEPPAELDYEFLMSASANEVELRQVWDQIIDKYVELDQDIPDLLSVKFTTKLNSFKGK